MNLVLTEYHIFLTLCQTKLILVSVSIVFHGFFHFFKVQKQDSGYFILNGYSIPLEKKRNNEKKQKNNNNNKKTTNYRKKKKSTAKNK